VVRLHNSPACSPRRERRRVFRALFPACGFAPRIVRPSGPGLRPGDNGDRSLRVGARSTLESRALGTQRTIQAHSPRSGDRRARPRPGQARRGSHPAAGFAPGAQKTPHQNRSAPSCAGTWPRQERSSMGPRSGLRGTLHPAQERFVRFLVYGERAVLIGKSKRENVL